MQSRFLSMVAFSAAVAALTAPVAGEPTWVAGSGEVPPLAVYAGSEGANNYYVCRGEHLGGVHPGKTLAGKCNIEFAGGEIALETFEVLLEEPDYVRWTPDSMGAAPADAFPVGGEDGSTLYSCVAEVEQRDSVSGDVIASMGTHAGKIKGTNCNIPYGGGAYLTERYWVLVILTPTDIRRNPGQAGQRAFKPANGTYDLNGRKLGWRKTPSASWTVKPVP